MDILLVVFITLSGALVALVISEYVARRFSNSHSREQDLDEE